MDPQDLFLANLTVVERIVGGLCRRHALFGDVADDFGSWVKEKLIEDDYRIVRSFAGRSSFPTFLVIVITNLLRDYNVKRWGRWRASAEAKRLGTVAVQLESLMYRDGFSLDEASQVLRSRGAAVDGRELATMAARVPARVRSRDVGDAGLEHVHSELPDPESQLELDESRSAVVQRLEEAIASLDGEDQLILRLRFWDGLTVATIARTLQLEQKPLYRRIERLLLVVRARMVEAGVDEEMIADLLRHGAP